MTQPRSFKHRSFESRSFGLIVLRAVKSSEELHMLDISFEVDSFDDISRDKVTRNTQEEEMDNIHYYFGTKLSQEQ